MIKNTEFSGKSLPWTVLLLITVLAFLTVSGCAGGKYARFDRDRELNKMYLNYEVLPDHNYYTSGGYDAPDAILALKNEYELVDTRNLWVYRPDVSTTRMRIWIDTIAPDQNYRRSNAYFAAYILDPAGKRIGAWYAVEPNTTVKFLDNNKVQIYPPHQDFNIRLPRSFPKGGIL